MKLTLKALFVYFAATFFAFSSANAATITVNTFEDEFNDDGDCSLREAVVAANTNSGVDGCTAGSGVDTITLQSGTYSLYLSCYGEYDVEALGSYDSSTCGDLDVTESLIVNGAGKALTVIQVGEDFQETTFETNGSGSEDFRIFHLRPENNDFDVDGLKFCEGNCSEGTTLTLANMTLQNGSAYKGGAVRIDTTDSCQPSKLISSSVAFTGNFAHKGGAIYADGYVGITDTNFSSNFSRNSGGAAYLRGITNCSLENSIVSSTFEGGFAFQGSGGAILSDRFTKTTVAGSTFTGNSALITGGAIMSSGDLVINESSFDGNGSADLFVPVSLRATIDLEELRSPVFGGAIAVGSSFEQFMTYDHAEIPKASLMLSNSSVTNNTSAIGGAGVALLNLFIGIGATGFEEPYLIPVVVDGNIRNTQISQNVTELPVLINSTEVIGPFVRFNQIGGGIFNAGGGQLTVESSTIDSNSAAFGGGIGNSAHLSLVKSTVSNNRALTADREILRGAVTEGDTIVAHLLSGGGGVYNLGSLDVVNSTISGNTTDGSGAGLLNYSTLMFARLELNEEPLIDFGARLNNTTIVKNSIVASETEFFEPKDYSEALVNNGGGIASFGGSITLANTVVAANSDDIALQEFFYDDATGSEELGDFAPDCYVFPVEEQVCEGAAVSCGQEPAEIISAQYNLIGNNLGCSAFSSTANEDNDIIGSADSPVNPLLSDLGPNGGTTLTHLPQKGSPVIDAGSPAAIVTPGSLSVNLVAGEPCSFEDQREVTRPIDGSVDGIVRCDIGAVEVTVDCDGTPGGSAVIDACGVCGGDGTSCIVPEVPQTQLVCQQTNIFDTLIVLDGSGHDLARLSTSLVRSIVAKGGKKKKAKKDKEQALLLKQTTWDSTWKIPNIIQSNCTGTANVVCASVSNEPLKSDYLGKVSELYKLNQALIKQLKRLGGKKKGISKIEKKNDTYFSTALATLDLVPASRVSCS